MTIDEIYKNQEISVRSYHVCKYNELNSISDLKKYYYKNQSFEKLRNCGRKSNEELIDICNKYSDEYVENKEIEVKKENPLKGIISDLTRVQREVLNSFISENTSNLSVRSKNGISQFLNGNFKIKNFADKIFLADNFNANKIKNIGPKSAQELENYFDIIEEIIYEVYAINDNKELTKLRNKFLMVKKFEEIQIPDDILEVESIFKIIDYLLYQNVIFDKTQTIIIKNALKLYHNRKEKNLDEISNILNLSRERVRQIRKVCLDDLFNKLLFISNFNDDLFQKYNIDVESIFININSVVLEKINSSNSTNFSKEFINYIVAAHLNNSFSLVGNYEDVLQPKYFNSSDRHIWKNFYLIKKELVLEFDFTYFTNDISNRISDRIEESYSLNFKSYLSKFLTNNKTDILDFLMPICEHIINEEFEIYLDLNENLIFKRNTTKQVHEYIIEALESLKKPSKLSEIYEWICNLYPEATKSEEALRASCQRSSEIIYFGRSSTFGLKKWENTRNDIKGGTIKDIVTELLENSKNPIHITEILEEVHKYRAKTNERNIITNLKLDPSKSFVIFNQKFVGLSNKINDYDLIKYEKLPIQLGKIIKGKLKKNTLNDINQMSNFLNKNYNLTLKETKNILTLLNINL